MAANKSAFEEAISFLGNTFDGNKSAGSSGTLNFSQDYAGWKKKQNDDSKAQQGKISRFLNDAKSYFNPEKAATGPNFWTTPVAQKMANVQTAVTKPVQDVSAMIKAGPKKYFNPEEAPNGANFWNTKAAQGLANIQQNTPVKHVSWGVDQVKKYGPMMDEPVTQAFKGMGAVGLRQLADIQEGNGLFNKILQVGSGAFLVPEEQRKEYAKLYNYWAEGLSQSALKDKAEVEAFMQANPIAADNPQLGLAEKFKDPEFVARGLLLNAPSLFINLAASLGTLALTKNPVLASQVALGTGFVMEGGTAYTDALDEGVPEPVARGVGVGVGIVNSFLERIFPMAKLDDLTRVAVKQSIMKNAYKFVKDAVLKEGAQETLQEIVSNVGKAVYDENYRSLAGVLQGAPEAGIFGMLLGGVANVGMTPFQGSMATNPNIGPVTTSMEERTPVEQFRVEPKEIFSDEDAKSIGRLLTEDAISKGKGLSIDGVDETYKLAKKLLNIPDSQLYQLDPQTVLRELNSQLSDRQRKIFYEEPTKGMLPPSPYEKAVDEMPNLLAGNEQFRMETGAPATNQVVQPTGDISRSVGITPATTNPTMSGTVAYDLTSQYNQAWAAGDYQGAEAIRTQLLEQGRNDLLGRFADIPDIKLNVTPSHSTYFGESEPTLIVNATMPKGAESDFIKRISQASEDWGQQTVHFSEKFDALPDGQSFGIELPSGFTFEPGIDIRFSRPLTYMEQKVVSDEVQKLGLAGSTFHSDNSGIFLYNISKFKGYEEFINQAGQIAEATSRLLSGGISDSSEKGVPQYTAVWSARRLLVGGSEEGGATRNYEQLRNYVPPTNGSYRIQIEEAPYNLDVSQVEKVLNQFFDENEIKFIASEPGAIVTKDGQIAVGKYTNALIQAVQQDGKVQEKTVYHEAFHAYDDMFADPELSRLALNQIKEELYLKDDMAGKEALAERFAEWVPTRTGVTGKIKVYFEWLWNEIKGLIGKKNQVEAIFQEMLAKKRAAGIKSGKFALSYRDAKGVSMNGVYQPNLTAKIIQTLINEVKGGEDGVTSVEHIKNITNRGGLKQIERELALDVANRLAVDGKVNVEEFVKAYKRGLLPLESGTETSWERITLPDEVRGNVNEYYERIYSSPFETSLGKHFRNFPNYFAHVRVEDMDDATARLAYGKDLTVKEVKTEEYGNVWQIFKDGKPLEFKKVIGYPGGFTSVNRFALKSEALNMAERLKVTNEYVGGTRRLIEIQSDMFQIPTEDFERQFASPLPLNKLSDILDEAWDNNDILFAGKVRDLQIQDVIKEAELDKRYSSKIESRIKNFDGRIQNSLDRISEYKNELKKSPSETEQIQLQKNIADEERYLETDRALKDFHNKLLKQLPDPPPGAMSMDKMLLPYKNVWFERIIKEELARAAADGKEKIKIPTGETIARIEGYVGSGVVPEDVGPGDTFTYGGDDYIVLEDLGGTVTATSESNVSRRFDWQEAVDEEVDNEIENRVIYELNSLEEGRTPVIDFDLLRMLNYISLPVEKQNAFKTNPREFLQNKTEKENLISLFGDEIRREVEDKYTDAADFAKKWSDETGETYYAVGDEIVLLSPDSYTEELSRGTPEEFDEGQLTKDQMTIYNRYQNEYPKYLKKMRPDLKEVTDDKGMTWWETRITSKDKAAIEAFRTEKKNAPPKVEARMENTEDFFLAMRALRKFRGYKVEMYEPSPVLSDQELSMKALAESRGFQPIPEEMITKIAPEAMDRINELNDMRAEFTKQIGDIESVNKNYDFYTKRFGKIMYKKELSDLKSELKNFVKNIDSEIKELQKQTFEIEKPAPSNEELAMKMLEQSRSASQGQMSASERPAVAPAELPPSEPAKEPAQVTGPEGFEENAQKENIAAFRNKARTEGLPPDLSARNDNDKFNTIISWMIGQHHVAQIIGTEMGEQLADISKSSGLDVLYAREEGGSSNPEINAAVQKIGVIYDELYNVAKDVPEIDMGYIENYITHIWKKKMEDVASAYRQWKTKFNYSNERIIPKIKEGIAMGLELKYEHPAPIIAEYATKLYQTIANIKAFKAMRESGLLIPYQQAKKIPGYIPVVAPGIRRSYSIDTSDGGKRTVAGDYYAPRSIANVLNRVFSPQEPVGNLEKGLSTAARISGAMQDIGLSGGVPYTPINAWTFGQIYREMATNIGGMLTSPLYSIKRMGSLVGSTLRPLIPGASMNFFKNNVGQIKKMAARNIPVTTIYTIDDIMDTSFKNKFIGKDFRSTWNKAVFDATFRKFMPMVQISMFNQIESAALGKGYSPDQPADVAADAVKKFYGVVGTDDKVLRSRVMEDVLTTFFFAPRYRETMARSWLNTMASVLPVRIKDGKLGFNNPFSLENKTNTNLMIGTIFTLAVYNLLNYALTGRRLKDNPPGTEDKLLIPLNDGYTMGIPLFPSTGTVVRYGLGFLNELKTGDTEGMVDQGKNLLSFMIRPVLDGITNNDYFGNKIYADTDDAQTRWKKIGSYIALQYNHPWIKSFIYQNGGWFLGKEFEKKPDYQNLLAAFEAPTRFYKSKSLSSRYYYENLKNVRGTLSPDDQKVWDKLHAQGGYFFDIEDGLPVYDKRSAMANALDRLAHPDIVRAETEAAIKTAQEQGTPIAPFYTLEKDQQFIVLLLKSFYPGDPQYKERKNANIDWLQPYWDKTNAWSKEMVRLGVFEDKSADVISQSRKQAVLGLFLQGVTDANAISTMLNEGATRDGYKSGDWTPEEVSKYITSNDFIQATPELQAKLDYYNTLPNGTGARSRYINANPDIKAYFDALTARTNMSRWELGLPPISGFGGSGYGDYTKKIKINIPKVNLSKNSIKLSNYKLSDNPIKSRSVTSNLPKIPISAPKISSGYQMRNLAPLTLKNLVPSNLSQIGRR